MGKHISFIFLIFFLSCGPKETIKETTTTKETVMPLSEGYNKQVDELKTKITAMSAELESSAKISEAEKNALKNQIESLHKQQTNLEKQLEVLKGELPKPKTPKLNLSPEEQKVLDWLRDKMKYGKITIPLDKIVEAATGTTRYQSYIEIMDNFLFTAMNLGSTEDSYMRAVNEPKLTDFNFIFYDIGYKIENGRISYCHFYNTDDCKEDSCVCKMFSAECNLKTDSKCFQNIILGDGDSFQFDLVPNHKAKICEMNITFTTTENSRFKEGKVKCNIYDKLPTEIPFRLTFIVNKDGIPLKIKDQNETVFENVTVHQFIPDKKH